jgi:K+-sensing histidine kinase KdpD
MKTYFAPAQRATPRELDRAIKIASNNPVVSGLLHSVSGLLAVLDEHRQIVSLNDSFLRMLGVDDPGKALGLRPGEALQCNFADTGPGGCGTSEYCSSCGAAIAIVSSLEQHIPVEKICSLTARRGDKEVDIALLVKSHPIKIDQKRFLLLFLQDITQQQQRAALERTFFHDINNMLCLLLGVSERLALESPGKLTKSLHQTVLRLEKEVAIQRCLLHNELNDYLPVWIELTTGEILAELEDFFANHPVARNRNIQISKDQTQLVFKTDNSLLLRVLCNMIINALEATPEDGTIKIWIESDNGCSVTFCVWNAQEIPQETTRRIFQRNFSTKEQAGRGIGTYSMKLLGEKLLGGKVAFATTKEEGTTFRFTLPL